MTENKDVSFTVSGLEKEKSYDLYYVAQDTAGNYSDTVKKITIHTLDQSAPTVTQEFTRFNGTDATHPLPDTDVRLVFSEPVLDTETGNKFSDLYQDVLEGKPSEAEAREKMASVLRNNILLYEMVDGIPKKVVDRSINEGDESWTIDYRYAEVSVEEGKTVITFPTESDNPGKSALKLKSGATYYFEIINVADTSSNQNKMGDTPLDKFTTVFAQVNLSAAGNSDTEVNEDTPIDAYWRLSPVSTQNVDDSIKWDMLIWVDTTVEFTLWGKVDGAWKQIGDSGPAGITVSGSSGRYAGASVTMSSALKNQETFEPLNLLQEDEVYEYAISFHSIRGEIERDNWSGTVNLKVNVVAGSNTDLKRLAVDVTEDNWDQMVGNGVTNIGQPDTLELHAPFQDKTAPDFINGYPMFEAGDSIVNMSLMLSRRGTIYYVVAPKGDIATKKDGVDYGSRYGYNQLPEDGLGKEVAVDLPTQNNIVNANETYPSSKNVKYGSLVADQAVTIETVEGLQPNTDYIAYFVVQGTSQVFSPVFCYRFATGDVNTPFITLREESPKVTFTTSEDADLDYVLFASNRLPDVFTRTLTENDIAAPDGETSEKVLEELKKDAPNGKVTALYLMLQTRQDGYSWLDYYGSDTLKKDVSEYILRSSAGGGSPAGQGSMVTEKDQSESVDFTNDMNEVSGTLYYCLAAARNVLGGEYSFKAVSDVHIPDTETPTLTVSSVNNGSSGKPPYVRYHGSLTLNFNEPLYWLPESGDPEGLKPVYNRSDDSKTGHALLQHIGVRDIGDFSVTAQGNSPTSSFTLNYRDIFPGDTIQIFSDGFISDRSANSTRERITLQFQERKTGVNGAKTYEWVIVS